MNGFVGITLDRVETQPVKNGKIAVRFYALERTMERRESATYVEIKREKRTFVYEVETANVIEAIKTAIERYEGVSVSFL